MGRLAEISEKPMQNLPNAKMSQLEALFSLKLTCALVV